MDLLEFVQSPKITNSYHVIKTQTMKRIQNKQVEQHHSLMQHYIERIHKCHTSIGNLSNLKTVIEKDNVLFEAEKEELFCIIDSMRAILLKNFVHSVKNW